MSSILLLGFLIGMRHALEADHLAAVASLAAREATLKRTLALGAVWGLGHSLTLLAVGSAVIFSDGFLPERVARLLEGLVGVMLVLLGADLVRRLIRERVHFHLHRHGETLHFHAHAHAGEGPHADSAHDHRHPKGFPFRALFVGLMHGLAGSAALILLTLEGIDRPALAFGYMLLFGVGSIAGMAALSCVIALPMRFAAKHLTWAYKGLSAAIALFTVGLGCLILYDTALAATGL